MGLLAGENSPRAKFSWIQVKEIREKWNLIDENSKRIYTKQQLANEYEVSHSAICHILANRTWKEELNSQI
jgi:hypothetical protein